MTLDDAVHYAFGAVFALLVLATLLHPVVIMALVMSSKDGSR